MNNKKVVVLIMVLGVILLSISDAIREWLNSDSIQDDSVEDGGNDDDY